MKFLFKIFRPQLYDHDKLWASLFFAAARVASQWLELLHQDIKGRLAGNVDVLENMFLVNLYVHEINLVNGGFFFVFLQL